MTTPLTLTRPAKIHCLARPFGVSGCFRSNQSNSGPVLVSITFAIVRYSRQHEAGIAHYNSPLEAWSLVGLSRGSERTVHHTPIRPSALDRGVRRTLCICR